MNEEYKTDQTEWMRKARTEWLQNPTDLHYRGELIELGVRVTDAIEDEMVQMSQRLCGSCSKRTARRQLVERN